ncbi:MAG: hypothetical protein M0T70_16700 [Geobacteraceae bacterium]|nr:hypothetical protein [Geobacteraceae bacterium]
MNIEDIRQNHSGNISSARTWCLRRMMAILLPHLPALVLLLLLAGAIFADIPTHSFLVKWDDPEYVTANVDIRGLNWDNIQAAFTHTYVGNYAPLQIVSYMLDYQLWGLRPLGFLLTNVWLHLLSALLLYLLLLRLGSARWGAIMGGAIFLAHPVQIESVLWVSQRKSVLAMMFFLLAFHCYLNYREPEGRNRKLWYAASISIYLLAALSKSIAVIFPLALMLYDGLYCSEPRRLRSHADKLPYLLISLVIGIATIMIQTPGTVGGRTAYPPDFIRVWPLTMFPVLADYLRMIVWPDPAQLSLIYTVPWSSAVDMRFTVSAVIAIMLAITAVFLQRKAPRVLFWYGLFFLGLLPVLQLIPLVTKMNDRYLYFPMLGVAGLCAYAVTALQVRTRSGIAKSAVATGMTGIIAVLAIASYQRSLVWRSTVTLFSDAVAKSPNQYIPWIGLAAGYHAEGNLEEALRCCDIASKYGYLDANDAFAIARIYLERGEPDKAYTFIWGGILKSRTTEGKLLLGLYYGMKGNLDEAEKQLLNYLKTSDKSAEGLTALAKVYLIRGDLQKAAVYAERGLVADPNLPEAYIVEACVAGTKNDLPRSIALLNGAVQHGFADWQQLEDMDCLAAVRNDPSFKHLLPDK